MRFDDAQTYVFVQLLLHDALVEEFVRVLTWRVAVQVGEALGVGGQTGIWHPGELNSQHALSFSD